MPEFDDQALAAQPAQVVSQRDGRCSPVARSWRLDGQADGDKPRPVPRLARQAVYRFKPSAGTVTCGVDR